MKLSGQHLIEGKIKKSSEIHLTYNPVAVFGASNPPLEFSVASGTSTIKRFLRPICYQNFSSELLPEDLKSSENRT